MIHSWRSICNLNSISQACRHLPHLILHSLCARVCRVSVSVCVSVWHDCWYPGGKTQLLNNEPACLYSKRAFIHPSAWCQPFDICPRRALGEISPQDLFMPQWNTATWTCARPVKMSKFHCGLVRVCAHSVKRQLRGKLQLHWEWLKWNSI